MRWISLVLLLSMESIFALECGEFDYKYLLSNKTVKDKKYFCIDAKKSILLSKNCSDQKCLSSFKKLSRSQFLNDYKQGIGTKGFHLCHKINGLPQIIQLKLKEKWQTFDRCQYQGYDFDTETLYHVMQE